MRKTIFALFWVFHTVERSPVTLSRHHHLVTLGDHWLCFVVSLLHSFSFSYSFSTGDNPFSFSFCFRSFLFPREKENIFSLFAHSRLSLTTMTFSLFLPSKKGSSFERQFCKETISLMFIVHTPEEKLRKRPHFVLLLCFPKSIFFSSFYIGRIVKYCRVL